MANTTIIFALHPISTTANQILRDWRNTRMVQDISFLDEQLSEESLVFSLDRPPKFGIAYVIGRNDSADIVLTDPESSGQHCLITLTNNGVPRLHEQSTNGTYVDEVCRNNETIELHHGMQIGIRKASFHVWMPWRGQEQEEYEHNARRARSKRANTPVIFHSLTLPEFQQTALAKNVGQYELTNIVLSVRVRTRLEVVRRDKSFFVGKWFTRPKDELREVAAWDKLAQIDKPHPNIVQLQEIIEHHSSVVIITELLASGTLQQCKKLMEEEVITVMQQLFAALDFLHTTLNLVHRAILRDNILMSSRAPIHVKLTGFEYSSLSDVAEPISVFMEPGSEPPQGAMERTKTNSILIDKTVVKYQSPEVVEAHYVDSMMFDTWKKMLTTKGVFQGRSQPICGKPVDIWGCGVVCCELLFDIVPGFITPTLPIEEQERELVSFISSTEDANFAGCDVFWAKTLRLSEASISSFPLLQPFLRRVLNPDPSQRETVKKCLKDSWLTPKDKKESGSRKRKRSLSPLEPSQQQIT